MSSISDFPETDIRKAILKKAPLERINKSGKHWKGYIYVDDVFVGKVKIPNDHKRVMKQSKSKFIAQDLQLTNALFDSFVNCELSGPSYANHLRKTNEPHAV